MHVHQYFIIFYQVLTHLIHTFIHPITHISPHSHSLGDKDNSLSCLASTTKVRTNTKPRGEKKKGHLSLIKESVGHKNVHICGHGYTYRSINSAEHVHLEPQDHHHRRCTPPRLILTASQPVWCHPTTQPWATPESTGTLRL